MTTPAPGFWSGTHSGADEPGQHIARTAAEWAALWRLIHSNQHPVPPAPDMPADKMAVAVCKGMISSPADITLETVKTDDALIVSYAVKTRMSMLAVMHEPYAMMWVDKTDLPVTFAKTAPPAFAANDHSPLKFTIRKNKP